MSSIEIEKKHFKTINIIELSNWQFDKIDAFDEFI